MSIIALSKGQVECGKTVKDSKRRYYWLFKLDDTDHKLELIISFLTGKRKVILDQKVIYEQKSLLNIKFDFRHNIGYHNLQVSQQLKQFTLRINNEPFQSLLMNNVKFNLGIDKSKQINQAQQKKQTSNNPFSEFQTLCSSSPPKAVTSNAFEQFDMNFKYTPSSQPQQQTSELNFVNSNQQNKSINILAFENNFKQFDDFTQDQMFNTNAYIPGAQIYSGNNFEPKVEKSSSPLKAIVTKLQFGSFYEKPQYIPNSNNPFVNNNINTNMNINMNMNMNFNNPNTIQTTIKSNNNNNNNNNNSNNNNNNNLLDLDLL